MMRIGAVTSTVNRLNKLNHKNIEIKFAIVIKECLPNICLLQLVIIPQYTQKFYCLKRLSFNQPGKLFSGFIGSDIYLVCN
jgi:hypothetical protein